MRIAFIFSAIAAAGGFATQAHRPPAAPAQMDIGQGLRIGAGAHAVLVPWGGSATLAPAAVDSAAQGLCTVALAYQVTDDGSIAAGTVRNTVRTGAGVVAVNAVPELAPGQTRQLRAHALLHPGVNRLTLDVDVDHAGVRAAKPTPRAISVTVPGSCDALPQPRAELAARGLALGGDMGGMGSRSAEWDGEVTLRSVDAALVANGQCAFNLMYQVENQGRAATGAAAGRLYAGEEMVSAQNLSGLFAGDERTVLGQAYLGPGEHMMKLVLYDSGGAKPVEYRMRVNVASDCAAVPERLAVADDAAPSR
jgi:hypothetical protein